MISVVAISLVTVYTALLWLKDTSDQSPKFERVMFLDWMFYFQSEFWSETLILLKDICVKTSWYCIDVSVHVHDKHILLIYEKYHFQELLPFVREGQYTSA